MANSNIPFSVATIGQQPSPDTTQPIEVLLGLGLVSANAQTAVNQSQPAPTLIQQTGTGSLADNTPDGSVTPVTGFSG